MREIKFRGYDPNNEEWKYGSLIQYPNGNCVIVEFDTDGNELSYDVIPETVGEYTWTEDIDGEGIYEGDIVVIQRFFRSGLVYTHKSEVRFIYGCFCVMWREDGDYDKTLSKCAHDPDYQVCVIGNIHDNPELLNRA